MLRHRIKHWPLGAIYLVSLSNKLGRVLLEKRLKTPVPVKINRRSLSTFQLTHERSAHPLQAAVTRSDM